MHLKYRIEAISETAFTVYFGDIIDAELLEIVFEFKNKLLASPFQFLKECVTSYHSATIFFDEKYYLFNNDLNIIYNHIDLVINQINVLKIQKKQNVINIEVNYNGSDLGFALDYLKLSKSEFIRLHTEPNYKVALIGFLPGFPYLLGLNPALILPRKNTPAKIVKAGSVAIGGLQTGIYPIDSPGGWQVIGNTSQEMFSINNVSPSFLKAGDVVKFKAV